MSKHLLLVAATIVQLVAGVARGAEPDTALVQASAALARREYGKASRILEQALAASPADEQLYRALSDLYDQQGHSYASAIEVHARYLRRFPRGRFASLLRERQEQLQRHRAVWSLLRDYRRILASGFERTPAENIRRVQALLPRAAHSTLEPVLLLWLGSEHVTKDPARALDYFNRCLEALASSGGQATEQARVLTLRSQLWREQGHYAQALADLRRAHALSPGSVEEQRRAERTLVLKLWAQWGHYAAVAVYTLLLLLGLLLRPWRAPAFGWHRWQLVGFGAAITAVTLLPWAFLRLRNEKTPLTFVALAALGLAGLLGLKLLSPLAQRFGRPAYLVLSLLLVCSALYMAFYLGGTLEVLEWPFEASRRMR